jgi:exonuclease III
MYKIFYQNVGRVRSKINDIYLNVLNNDYDIICLTETNFDDTSIMANQSMTAIMFLEETVTPLAL